jgi:cyclophilin family peptidyl-prolyl cis-trans isomerase
MTFILILLFAAPIIAQMANIFMKPSTPTTEKVEIAIIETSMGTIEIELDRQNAPITVENFVTYANSGFYEGLVFHRVMRGFMIQGGGFDENGTYRATMEPIVNEAINGLSNLEGTVAMARTTEPDSATSQFYINTVDNTFLDYQGVDNPGYTVFGRVIEGMDVVKNIEGVATVIKNGYFPDFDFSQPMENWPREDVVIISVIITEE